MLYHVTSAIKDFAAANLTRSFHFLSQHTMRFQLELLWNASPHFSVLARNQGQFSLFQSIMGSSPSGFSFA